MNSPMPDASPRPWEPAPQHLRAERDEVHVFRLLLPRPVYEVESLRSLLSDDELSRADAFHFSRDRSNFIVGRGVLRTILGRYLLQPPTRLRFDYNPFGKPRLHNADCATPPRFNLSHAGDVILYAVADGREVGVDVERLREDVAYSEIAGQFFSGSEVAALGALPSSARAGAFFNCWTRKEAYVKARGTGLSLPLDAFDVSVAPGEPAALLETRHDPHDAARWSLGELTPAPGYVAALAVEGTGWRLNCWNWVAQAGAYCSPRREL
jgi:4'-phosphopantetheinyl transferase